MKISIITASYNRKDFLLQCIKSVQALKNSPLDIELEHIIYDDASTDGTEEIFSESIPNTIYLKGDENHGSSYGRNVAIEKAIGEYIFVLDSDDIILQRTIFNFAKQALENKEIDWFISDFLRVDENLSYSIGNDYYAWEFKSKKEILNAIFKGENFIQHNVFFKKELFIKVGGYDSSIKIAEDLDLFIRFLLNNSMPNVVTFNSHLHRDHKKNLSLGIDQNKHKEYALMLLDKYKNEFNNI